jgi:RNA polymerase sigma-70 factor (ECF subfamily)
MSKERDTDNTMDAALAASTHQAPKSWLEPIYRQHAAAVLQTAFRITGSPDDAEDVLHTVFERLARRSRAPDFSAGALPYLRRAAANAALDLLRSSRRRITVSILEAPTAETADASPAPDRVHDGRELMSRIRSMLAALTPRQAEMFVLRYFEGLDNRGIADYFDTTPGTVAVTLHRVRARLIQGLDQGGPR